MSTKVEHCAFCERLHEPVQTDSECTLLERRRVLAAALAVVHDVGEAREAIDDTRASIFPDEHPSNRLREALSKSRRALADAAAFAYLVLEDARFAEAEADLEVKIERQEAELAAEKGGAS